jgi:hypothetical protein
MLSSVDKRSIVRVQVTFAARQSRGIVMTHTHIISSEVSHDKNRILSGENLYKWIQKLPSPAYGAGNSQRAVNDWVTEANKPLILAKALHEISTLAGKVAPIVAVYGRVKTIQSTISKMHTRRLGSNTIDAYTCRKRQCSPSDVQTTKPVCRIPLFSLDD